jgi:hypothetical protein
MFTHFTKRSSVINLTYSDIPSFIIIIIGLIMYSNNIRSKIIDEFN